MFPPECSATADVYHLDDATGVESYVYSESLSGAFLPLDRKEHALEGGSYVDGHEFYVAPDADIRVTDKLVIQDDTYYVKNVFSASFGGLSHKRASISKQA